MGFIFSSRGFILSLDKLSPLNGLIIYYIILYSSLYFLSRLGLTVFGIKIFAPAQMVGLLLITFAFFIVVDWESSYINIVTRGSAENISPVYFQSEDGSVWSLWSSVTKDVEALRLLTYVVTPFLLALAGGLLVSGRIFIL
jgi:hypothetical protein